VPIRCAEHDNNDYFNKVYAETNREPIEHRYVDFVRYDKIHSSMHARDLSRFQSLLQGINRRIISARISIEIGFGYGNELLRFLEMGANIYGLDISEIAVSLFKTKYPNHAERVHCGTDFDCTVDLVYSNALFEHLDDPGEFLENAFSMLDPGGTLIMRLPVVNRMNYTKRQISFDINFWRPCHRVLYTLTGLRTLLDKYGFKITEHAKYDYYGYKVMNSLLRHGYRDIENVRHPCLEIRGLRSKVVYKIILIESLLRQIICSDFVVVAEKQG